MNGSRRITEGCEICDGDAERPIPHTLLSGPLYDGICAECWLEGVREEVTTIEDVPAEVQDEVRRMLDEQEGC